MIEKAIDLGSFYQQSPPKADQPLAETINYELRNVVELMPIFEYICKKCQKQFELLIYSNDIPECPACKSQELSKLISRVSLGAGTGSSGGSKCSSCSSGHCSHC